jgi:hypothetical protein
MTAKIYQTGKTDIHQDRQLSAKKPGKRKAKSGKTYTEHR